MSNFLCLFAILPCLLAAEVKSSICPDGLKCPLSKSCCQLRTGISGCCDVPEELQDEDLLPAIPATPTLNESLALPQILDYCPGTMCSTFICCPFANAMCCSENSFYCCPSEAICCSDSGSKTWCCLEHQLCGDAYYTCLSGAESVKVAVLPLLLVFVMVFVSKYLF